MPKRIQMTRRKPWRKDNPDAVIVARPSEWGNPFKIGEDAIDATQATIMFERYLDAHHAIKAGVEKLRGKDLACWCSLDQPCHADVLLKLANK